MDAREKWQTLQRRLATARALAEAGDRTAALAEVERALEIDPEFLAAHSLKEHLAPAAVTGDPSAGGMPSSPATATGTAPALTAIEAKVIARRAERRLATAADAVARRDFAVAAAALDEARELGADPGQLLRVERALAEARRSRRPRTVTGRRVAAAAAVVIAAIAARYMDRRHVADRPAAPPATASSTIDTTSTTGIATPMHEVIKLQPATPPVLPASPPAPRVTPAERAAAVPTARAEAPSTPSEPAPPSIAMSAPIGPIAPPAFPSEPPADKPVAASAAVAPPPAPVALPTAQPIAPPPHAPEDEGGVRDALQRYRAAYDQLNARSARAVWPAVDERALARAFDNLSSQQLRFDACDVNVRGIAATATCRGTATYTPKIGSGDAQVEPRTWQFTLRKDAGQWAIQTARVER